MTDENESTNGRFEFIGVSRPSGDGIYAAPHELHNEVVILLPEHYFGEGKPWPKSITVPNFEVIPDAITP